MKFEKNIPFDIPVLPTIDLVVFPGQNENLYVARPKSVASLLLSVATDDSYVVISCQKEIQNKEISSFDEIFDVGTLCRVSTSAKYDKGFKITISGIERVKLSSLKIDNNAYIGNCTLFEDELGDQKQEGILIKDLFTNFEVNKETFFENCKNCDSVLGKVSKGLSALDISYALSSNFNLNYLEKIKLLEAANVNDRLVLLTSFFNSMIENNEIENKLQKEVRDSAEKSQKEYFLREKMKAIKKELGEDDGDQDPDLILDKVDKGNYPQNIKNKVHDEMKKYNLMPQGSLEGSLIRSYIDILLSLPWTEKTNDNDDLKNVQKILDEDHYGLDKPKKRIIEYLAVKKLTGNLKAPILCFYGPPGTGKTSLAKSIARALDRKFIKASLGGITDESEIRGHRRTYVGSMPGRIIQGMRKAKTVNPVFLLDEIDKLGNSYKGDPSSALLEVLDPEQNNAFADNFIEEPYDLSNVLFICTANYLENIPSPLLDRLELIELNSYTAIEKMHIAKEHLIKKCLAANGLSSDQIEFDDHAIDFIIERYTREAGVRELERLISSICRKVCVELVNDSKLKKVIVHPHEVKKYLGIEIFESTQKEKGEQVGVVTGLAYTEYGGDILPIEVNYFPGKGALILTGKLGDVMKESCSIALDYVRANAKKYGIDSNLFDKRCST